MHNDAIHKKDNERDAKADAIDPEVYIRAMTRQATCEEIGNVRQYRQSKAKRPKYFKRDEIAPKTISPASVHVKNRDDKSLD